MEPIVTKEEHRELEKLLSIIRDESRSPGERRIAMAKFDRMYQNARVRTNLDRAPNKLKSLNA